MEQKVLTRQEYKQEEQKQKNKATKENQGSFAANLASISHGCWH